MRKILPTPVFLFFVCVLVLKNTSFAQIANYQVLDQNNVSCILSDEGGFFNNTPAGIGGYEIPKGDSIRSIFAGSFMIGAQDPLGQVYLSGRAYSNGGNQSSFHSGPIADPFYYGSSTYSSVYQNALWKVTKAEIQTHQLHYQNVGYQMPNSILKWPGNGMTAMGVAPQLAPFIDLNQNGVYEPALGDYPDIRGDAAVYIIMNDESYQPDGNQLRVELHVMFYQFSTGNYLNNTTFMNVKAINRSSINYQNYHQGIYIDYDIGSAFDDYIGCSPEKNMLFAYNGDNFDETDAGQKGYGANPPSQALVSLSHPLKNGVVILQTNTFDYGDTSIWLLMNGLWQDTTPWINPLTNSVTDFIYPDNPNNINGWSEQAINNPSGDRRGMITIYEQSFRPGTTICTDYAFIYSRVGSNLQNIQDVWNIAGSLQSMYNSSESFPCKGSSTAGVSSDQEEEILLIAPNPASDNLTIQTTLAAPYSIEVTDASGKVILQHKEVDKLTYQLNLDGICPGTYFIRIANNQQMLTKKMLIE